MKRTVGSMARKRKVCIRVRHHALQCPCRMLATQSHTPVLTTPDSNHARKQAAIDTAGFDALVAPYESGVRGPSADVHRPAFDLIDVLKTAFPGTSFEGAVLESSGCLAVYVAASDACPASI